MGIDGGWYTKNDDTKDGNLLFTFAQPGDIRILQVRCCMWCSKTTMFILNCAEQTLLIYSPPTKRGGNERLIIAITKIKEP
ncbi:MAG: hypothetical protein J6S23_00660 [Clostridia bacterium]|nr:hypothetical protein [Clostridia bacterium]